MRDDTWNKIAEIYRKAKAPDRLFLRGEIPEAKLLNAKTSYAPLNDGESVILLFDETVFGSSKEGFVLSSAALYSKNMWENGTVVSIGDIKNMTMSHGLLISVITVVAEGPDEIKIQITQAPGKKEKDILFDILYKTVELLKGEVVGVEGEPDLETKTGVGASRSTICSGCGAPISRHSNTCEYCGISR